MRGRGYLLLKMCYHKIITLDFNHPTRMDEYFLCIHDMFAESMTVNGGKWSVLQVRVTAKPIGCDKHSIVFFHSFF